MNQCFFVSDIHGKTDRYLKLFKQIEYEKPDAVFFGGDLLPHGLKITEGYDDFALDFIFPKLYKLKETLKKNYPHIFLILGNDDARSEEEKFIEESNNGLFHYANEKKIQLEKFTVFGYSFVPPTPFQMKDWEKYDVSRYVDPGCIPPTEGFRTTDIKEDIEYATIKNDLDELTKIEDLSNAIFLFHSPPYKTFLDRAGLDGKMIDYVPMDVNVGSIAIKRLIEEKQPLVTLHGHIHESARLTGQWNQQIGRTTSFNAAHDGPELSIIKFNLEDVRKAKRFLL
ncbi:MAG: metallophosphoesterase [Bacteroidales bacterium]|nr:metallophosphoesterase [Bacteroidales bacterium]